MQREKIRFCGEPLRLAAAEIFDRIKGFSAETDRHGTASACAAAAHGPRSRTACAVVLTAGAEPDGRIKAGEHFIASPCAALNSISAARFYVFALTAGEAAYDTDSTAERYFADVWGTAYAGAARELLRRKLAERAQADGLYLSQCMGPGFFGMPLSETESILAACGADEAGMIWRDGTLLPEKSCTGIFAASATPLELPAACAQCAGAAGGCLLCEKRGQ